MPKFSKRTLMFCALLLVVLLATGCFSLFNIPDDIDDNGDTEPQILSLREIYKDHFEIGGAVAVASWASNTLKSHEDLIVTHLSSLTAENAMKPDYLQGREGSFNFAAADEMVAFAQEHNMKVRGHTLVWHAQTPDWFFRDKMGNRIDEKEVITEEDRQLVQQRMEDHIEAVMTHFGDSIYAWDVVNEAVTDDWQSGAIHRHDSPWYRIFGDDFMKIAFEKAHEVNPNAKLFYNDYNSDMVYKRGRTVDMLKALLDDGVPIHGIGIQGHWGVDVHDYDESNKTYEEAFEETLEGKLKEIEDALNMYINLGLEIHITEMDVAINDYTEEEQAEWYRGLFQLFKDYSDHITSVTLWGVADDASWIGHNDPLLFDRNHEPKPAFWAVVDTNRPWQENKAKYSK